MLANSSVHSSHRACSTNTKPSRKSVSGWRFSRSASAPSRSAGSGRMGTNRTRPTANNAATTVLPHAGKVAPPRPDPARGREWLTTNTFDHLEATTVTSCGS